MYFLGLYSDTCHLSYGHLVVRPHNIELYGRNFIITGAIYIWIITEAIWK